MNHSILIVGSDGCIGRELSTAFEASGKTIYRSTHYRDLAGSRRVFIDLSEDVGLWNLPSEPISTAIICAAVTSQEKCRLEPDYSRRVNVKGTVALAKQLIDRGVFVVFISTNLVFVA